MVQLADKPKGFDKIKILFKNALASLQEAGKYSAKDLAKVESYIALVNGYNSLFTTAISKGLESGKVPKKMLKLLQDDAFIFSKLKSHAALVEAFGTLVDADGKVKPWTTFLKETKELAIKHNELYLEAEYLFATDSAQMAANWVDIAQNGDDYNLQYRTAQDEKVRAEHAALHNITLPPSDPFWDSYYPPNGWRCRCTAKQVLKEKYDVSDSKKSQDLGEKATTKLNKSGKNTLEIFRFNPGKDGVVFPPTHPYTKVTGSKTIKGS